MEFIATESAAWVALLLRHYTNMERQAGMFDQPQPFFGEVSRGKLAALRAEAARREAQS